MSFRTKLDYSDNRQIQQRPETRTILSGGTAFGVTFSALTTGPDLLTTGITSSVGSAISTFSGNSATTVFNWYDPIMQLGHSSLTAITPSTSANTQNTTGYSANTTTIIDGNIIALDYVGVNYDITCSDIYDLGGGDYSGTAVSLELDFISAEGLDFTGRTIWADVSGITRTENLIITNNPIIGNVWMCIDSEGRGYWSPVSAASTTDIWISGTGLNSAILNGGGGFASGDYSVAEGYNTIAIGNHSHAEGWFTTAIGIDSHAEGSGTTAIGEASHAEGYGSTASGNWAHAEGYHTMASNYTSHAEGSNSTASGFASHAEGNGTMASGFASHAEGNGKAFGDFSHAEGGNSTASGNSSHSEGWLTIASGDYGSHAEGYYSRAIGEGSHAEGGVKSFGQTGSTASGVGSHSEGIGTRAIGNFSHAEGRDTTSSGNTSHAEGGFTTAGGNYSHSEGNSTTAIGEGSHAEGYKSRAIGEGSHAEGGCVVFNVNGGTAIGNGSHAEGGFTTASGDSSHAEGYETRAFGEFSHAEGQNTTASGNSSHAEGAFTRAFGQFSHSEGGYTTASGPYSHAGGSYSTASGQTSFVHGASSIAGGNNTIVLGSNITGLADNTTYVDALNIKTVGSTAFANDIRIDANGNLTTNTSDERLKENIIPLSGALSTIQALQGVSYQWKDRNAGTDAVRLGFIAQQVDSVDSRLAFINSVDGYMGLHIDGIIPLLVEAVKELTSGSTIINNSVLQTQTVVAEDNNIDLNFGGTQLTAIDGGIRVLHAKGVDLSADFILDNNGDWTTNNDFKPNQITIPLFTPSGSTDTTGGLGNITRDDAYIYVKCSDGWKRSNLESF